MIAGRARKPRVGEGDRAKVPVAHIVLDGEHAREYLEGWEAGAPVERPKRLLFVASEETSAEVRRAVRAGCRGRGFGASMEPARSGDPARVAIESGLVGPDAVVTGTRPDLHGLGGIGAVVLLEDREALEELRASVERVVVVPRTRWLFVEGELDRWARPIDVAHALARALEEAGEPETRLATVHELRGPTIAAMPVSDRVALCAALGCLGVAAIVAPDARTSAWIRARMRSRRLAEALEVVDLAARPPERADGIEVAAERIGPVALQDPWPGSPVVIDPDSDESVDEVVLAGSLADLRIAGEVLRDRRVRAEVDVYVQPATQRVALHAIEEGLGADLVRAGASLCPPGLPVPSPAPGARRVVTSFTPGAHVLASTAVACASAVAGKLTDPDSMRRAVRRTGRSQT